MLFLSICILLSAVNRTVERLHLHRNTQKLLNHTWWPFKACKIHRLASYLYFNLQVSKMSQIALTSLDIVFIIITEFAFRYYAGLCAFSSRIYDIFKNEVALVCGFVHKNLLTWGGVEDYPVNHEADKQV